MALVVCPECGRERVSINAAACPECGFPIAEHFKNQAVSSGKQESSDTPDIYSEIKRLCKEFLENIGEDANQFKYTPKLKKGLELPDDAVVYLAHDDTLFHNGKNGFAITNLGIYCRDMMGETVFTSLEELRETTDLNWSEPDNYNKIEANVKLLTYYSNGVEAVESGIMSLLSDIIQLLSGKERTAFSGASESAAPSATAESVAPSAVAETVALSAAAESAAPPAAAESVTASAAGQNIGYNSVNNIQGFTDQQLYEKLSAVKVSFGSPILGDIDGNPAVLYKNVADIYDVFCRVNGNKVIIGKITADGVSKLETAANEGLNMLLGFHNEPTSLANRAVDELCGVVEQLENGQQVTESAASTMGEAKAFYMTQKALSLKPKFDIVDQNKNPVYHIEGDLARLNFSIQRNGEEVLQLKKKLVAIMPEYTVKKNGTEIAKIKKKFKLTNPELNGTVNGQELKINGSLFGYDFDILVGGVVIGHVDKDFGYWSDHYRIRSFDPNMQDILIAVSVICDNVADKEESD